LGSVCAASRRRWQSHTHADAMHAAAVDPGFWHVGALLLAAVWQQLGQCPSPQRLPSPEPPPPSTQRLTFLAKSHLVVPRRRMLSNDMAMDTPCTHVGARAHVCVGV
jgi:hypothetical protein